jgi:hypothetical protein
MLWSKFSNFTATHLELVPCVLEQLDFYSKDEDERRKVVERNLEYIAVRPWKSLDLDLTSSYRSSDDNEVNVSYKVYAHIEDEEKPCYRMRQTDELRGVTIQKVLDQYTEWHQMYWPGQQDCPLVFDAVVRRTRLVHYNPTERDINKVALSFYLFPEGFTV